jgi:hypothetical protein
MADKKRFEDVTPGEYIVVNVPCVVKVDLIDKVDENENQVSWSDPVPTINAGLAFIHNKMKVEVRETS